MQRRVEEEAADELEAFVVGNVCCGFLMQVFASEIMQQIRLDDCGCDRSAHRNSRDGHRSLVAETVSTGGSKRSRDCTGRDGNCVTAGKYVATEADRNSGDSGAFARAVSPGFECIAA